MGNEGIDLYRAEASEPTFLDLHEGYEAVLSQKLDVALGRPTVIRVVVDEEHDRAVIRRAKRLYRKGKLLEMQRLILAWVRRKKAS